LAKIAENEIITSTPGQQGLKRERMLGGGIEIEASEMYICGKNFVGG
jgi:hypothetical protein